MIFLLNVITTVCIGLLIGTEFAVSVFVNPILWKLENGVQQRTIRLFARRLGTAMPFWYVLSLVLLIAETIGHRHQRGIFLLGTASGIWIAVIIYTLLFLVPINNRMARMDSQAPLEEVRREHGRWDSLHRMRVASLGAAMICFLVAIQM